jgi:Domain of unknown function (DUF4328)
MSADRTPSCPLALAGILQAMVIAKGVTAGIIAVTLVDEALSLRPLSAASRLAPEVQTVTQRYGELVRWNTWLLLATIVIWLAWQFRLHRYLRATSPEPPTIGPGAGIGWWFVPFANLRMPVVVMRQLERASAAKSETRSSPAVVTRWAVPWIGQFVATYLVAFVGMTNRVSGIMAATWIAAVGEVLTVVAVLPAILLVRTLTAEAVGVTEAAAEVASPLLTAPIRPDLGR